MSLSQFLKSVSFGLCFLPIVLFAQVGSDSQVFVEFAENEFEALLRSAPIDIREKWRSRFHEYRMNVSQKMEQLSKIHKDIASGSSNKEIEGILAYSWLKEMGTFQLENIEELVESIGKAILIRKIENQLQPAIQSLEANLFDLRGRTQNPVVAQTVSTFFKLKSQINSIQSDLEIKLRFEYRPQHSAWDSNPSLVGTYIIHDWEKAFKQVENMLSILSGLETEIDAQNFLFPKDPLPFVAIGVQVTILLIAIAGYIISYTDNPSLTMILALVLMSMTISIVLIFISSSTMGNILVQAIIPAGFIFHWIRKRRREQKLKMSLKIHED